MLQTDHSTFSNKKLNEDQQKAFEILKTSSNVFLTGAAGSGKSFLLRNYLRTHNIPVLASTGAAAILVGGRTFHSFFGIGIMEGGQSATIERALKNKRTVNRLKKTDAVIIDEISMISGPTLRTAEALVRKCRNNSAPWGGLRVIVVGDFAQLPPVNPHVQEKEWAFLDEVWSLSAFLPVQLNKMMRTQDTEFLEVLNSVRLGRVTEQVRNFLDSRTEIRAEGQFTRLFSHRADVEHYNLTKLEEIEAPLHSFQTVYRGKEKDIAAFRKNSPIQDVIHLKEDALVMLRQNDPEGRWVNGSLGKIKSITSTQLSIRLLSGMSVQIDIAEFNMLDAEGNSVVTASNFPVSLAWAMTIHKAQGTSIDRLLVDLRKVWEPGQAYVALSRARDPNALFIEGWSERLIFADPKVTAFHASLKNEMASSLDSKQFEI